MGGRPGRPHIGKVIYRYLDCGDLHNGFARVKCGDCGHEFLSHIERSCRSVSGRSSRCRLPTPGH
ncbi:MAG: transposase zinc-binding domain-containing protein [Candidatus Ozemobacteraceae bacterium]